MTEQETAEQKLARLKTRQSEAHRKWRHSDKGKAYFQRQKEKRILGKPAESK